MKHWDSPMLRPWVTRPATDESRLERITYKIGLHRLSYWITFKRTGLY